MKKILFIIGLCLCLFVGGFYCYVNDYYQANDMALEVLKSNDTIKIKEEDEYFSFLPENPQAGFIFYPGGLVESESYVPLLKECAKNNILCILLKMPFHLAVFDMNRADGIIEKYNIEDWYIGGHSLGGVMASSYVSSHLDEYKGLILLASYSTIDLSKSNLKTLTVYGSEDKVLNREKYSENIKNLSNDYDEYLIDGGNHAYFACYGEQDGDGKAYITNQQQIKLTSEYIIKLIYDK